MIYGTLRDNNTYWPVARVPAIASALAWLQAMPKDQAPGVYELDGKKIYVNVHGYDTLARNECTFESHRVYADLQYCIEGGEVIDYAWRAELGTDRGPYDESKDVLFSDPPAHFSSLVMKPGDFAIFLPADAHRPKVHDSINPAIRKLVVKIDVSLLGES
jgi:YhcH/YjgK/YiaL family protein